MHPVLFTVFGIPVYSYGFFLACGFLFATLSAVETGKRFRIDRDAVMDLAVWLLISGVVGARLLYVLVNFPYYASHPLEIFMVNKGGLIYYGGLLAAVFSGILFIRKKNMGLLKTGDVIMAVLPVGQMFGRIGCFLNGCCFGTPCTLPFRVIYPMNSHAFQHYQEFQPVHPVQLYESLGTGLLFLALISIIERKRFHGQIVALYGMLYPALRFVLEFMRGDTTRHAADLTFAQYLSIPIFLISFVLYRVWSRKADRFAASSP